MKWQLAQSAGSCSLRDPHLSVVSLSPGDSPHPTFPRQGEGVEGPGRQGKIEN